jgi:hypothetical protein
VLGVVNNQAWLLAPDVYGGYNHANWRRITDIPLSSLFGTVSVLNDGRVLVHNGEYGSSTNQPGGFAAAKSQIFDPVTETWSFTNKQVSAHTSTNITDNGQILSSGALSPPNGDLTATVSVPGLAWDNSESQLITLPDGRFANFRSGNGAGGRVLQVIDTTASTVTATDFTSTLTGFIDNRAKTGNWTSSGTVQYEIGPGGWMPKIGKVALVGGQGWIMTYDPATGVLAKPAHLGQDPASSDPATTTPLLGTITSLQNGLAGPAVVSGGTFRFLANTTTQTAAALAATLNVWPTKNVYVRLAGNTSFVGFVYGSASVSGDTVSLIGISLVAHQGDYTTAMVTGDEVCWGRPTFIVQDGPGTFLPNGDLMVGGVAETAPYNNNFQGNTRYLKWDGVSAVAVPMTSDATSKTPHPSFVNQMFSLPDSTVFLKEVDGITGVGHRIYTPTSPEQTPFAGSRPVVSYFPTAVERNQTCFLYGTQLNGLHEGGMYGDDGSPRTNFPIVRFTNTTTGYVYTCRTYDYSYRGIATGQASRATVQIPTTVPDGLYDMTTVAGGVPSVVQQVLVRGGAMGDSVFINSYR